MIPQTARSPHCDACGRFIADVDLEHSLFDFEPLNEFGPEKSAWVCPRCVEKERNQSTREPGDANNAPGSNQ